MRTTTSPSKFLFAIAVAMVCSGGIGAAVAQTLPDTENGVKLAAIELERALKGRRSAAAKKR